MNKAIYILLTLLLAKAFAMIALIIFGPIGLSPDEAQYWTWSQHIDWGYYSKPPGIAWEIWLGTLVLGNSILGIRIFAVIIGSLIPILIYVASRRSNIPPNSALLAAIAFAAAPMGILSSLFAITDGGMLLFWTASIAYISGCIQKNQPPNYILVGLLIACGALFKWPAYLFWGFIFVSWPFLPVLRTPKVIIGIAISLLALLPSMYWNATHDWATFRHVSSTVTGGHGATLGNPLEYFGSQVAILSPILFFLIVLSFWRVFKDRKKCPASILFCSWITIALFFGGLFLSLFMKIQGNWAVAAYPSAFIVLAWFLSKSSKALSYWTVGGIVLSILLTIFTFAIPTIQSHSLFPQNKIPYKISPFKHNIGWENISDVLTQAGYNPQTDNLISDKYQTVSILSFYGPQQNRAFFLNLNGIRKNQFSYWPGIDIQKKRNFFVVIENVPHLYKETIVEEYKNDLRKYFSKVEFLGISPLFYSYGSIAKGALIFECWDFNGIYPENPDLY